MTPPTLSRRQLNRATLARQMLLEREPLAAAEAVQRLAGMQAQEPKHPFVGLWTRVAGFEREGLHDALLSREVVRATLMRSTLHLMGAADYVALRMALQPSMAVALRVLGARSGQLDLAAVLPAARALLDGNPMRFDRVDGVVAGTWTTQRRRSAAALRLEPFAPLPAATASALASEAEGLLRFAEPDAAGYEVTVGP
jgi:hypothetical protein